MVACFVLCHLEVCDTKKSVCIFHYQSLLFDSCHITQFCPDVSVMLPFTRIEIATAPNVHELETSWTRKNSEHEDTDMLQMCAGLFFVFLLSFLCWTVCSCLWCNSAGCTCWCFLFMLLCCSFFLLFFPRRQSDVSSDTKQHMKQVYAEESTTDM